MHVSPAAKLFTLIIVGCALILIATCAGIALLACRGVW